MYSDLVDIILGIELEKTCHRKSGNRFPNHFSNSKLTTSPAASGRLIYSPVKVLVRLPRVTFTACVPAGFFS